MRKAILIAIAVCAIAAQAEAEDDYTLKDWCKQFRPKICRAAMGACDGMAKRECDAATKIAVAEHPECEEPLMRFRKTVAVEFYDCLELEFYRQPHRP